MRAKSEYPTKHADQHLPWGSDPLEIVLSSGGGRTYQDVVMAHPCLVHYWPSDESSGNLIDRVGGVDLVPITCVALGDTYPKYGAAGPLTGLPDLTAVVTAGVFGVAPDDDDAFWASAGVAIAAGDFTVEMWVYMTSYDPGSTGVQTSELFSLGSLVIDVVTRKLRASYGASLPADPSDLPLNTWHYIVVRRQGTSLDLFRNGSLLDTDTVTTGSTSSSMSWLNNLTGPSFAPFNGRGAQLALYDCALTDAEITDHYGRQDVGAVAQEGWVLTSDGAGGVSYQPPTVEVEY